MKATPTDDHDEWTWHDQSLLYSAAIVDAVVSGRRGALPPALATSFAPQLDVDERILVHSWFTLSEWRSPGDGSYVHDSGWFFATGPAGFAASALVAGARAAGNSSRRAAAAAAAVPRWLEADRGDLFVSTAGFYLGSHLGLRTWGWASVVGADLVDPQRIQMVGNSTTGQVVWLLHTPWAPLLFALWAAHSHPNHPTFASNAWLPRGWWERAVSMGHQPAIGWSR